MPDFVFIYRNPKGYTPSPDSRAGWMSWFDGMADHLVELGRPVSGRTAIGECRPAHTDLGGYSVVQAEDLEAALAIARGCPYLDLDGGVEIGLLTEIPVEASSVPVDASSGA